MNLVFIYRPDIPKEFALGVMYVLKGFNTTQNMQLLRDYIKDESDILVFKWIESILQDNAIDQKYSLGWWKANLVGN
jgi:hypothetical protein